MKPARFAYARPDTLKELVSLLASEGEGAKILAGGLSLGAMLNMRLVTPRLLIDINRVAQLDAISQAGDYLEIGATVRQQAALNDVAVASQAPLFIQALRNVGHYQTRSRGTVCGSIAHGDPSAELPLSLMVADGEVGLTSSRGTRWVRAREFYVGPLQSVRRENEFVSAIRVKRRMPGISTSFREFAMRAGDYAIVACACIATVKHGHVEDIQLGFSGIGDKPEMVDLSALSGAAVSEQVATDVARRVNECVSPRGDLHATAGYRHHLCSVLAKEAVDDVLSQGGAEDVSR